MREFFGGFSPQPHPLNVKFEFRIPKPERSPNFRNPKARLRTGCGLRPSGFGFLSDFGLRASDFRFRGSMRESVIRRILSPLRGGSGSSASDAFIDPAEPFHFLRVE